MARVLLIFIMILSTQLTAADSTSPDYRIPDSCPFCQDQRESSEISERLVFEGKLVRVIHDRAPSLPGHLLVTPKRHVARLEGLQPQEWLEMHEIFQKLRAVFSAAYGKEDFLIMQRNGVGAGQTVFHVHFHCYPADLPQGEDILKEIVVRKPPMNPILLLEEALRLRNLFEGIDN